MKKRKAYTKPHIKFIAIGAAEMIAATISNSTSTTPEVNNTEFDAKGNIFDDNSNSDNIWNEEEWNEDFEL